MQSFHAFSSIVNFAALTEAFGASKSFNAISTFIKITIKIASILITYIIIWAVVLAGRFRS